MSLVKEDLQNEMKDDSEDDKELQRAENGEDPHKNDLKKTDDVRAWRT